MIFNIYRRLKKRIEDDYASLLSQDFVIKYIGILVIAITLPFAVFEIVNAHYVHFSIEMTVVIVFLQDYINMRLYKKPLIPRYLFAIVVGISIWLLTYYRGPVGFYWSYPYILFSYVILWSRSSVIIIIFFLIGMAPLAYQTLEGVMAFRVMISLVVTTLGIWFISLVVRQQQSSLFTSQEKYKTLVETSLQGLLIVNGNEKPIFANQAMANMLGFDSAEDLVQLESLESLYPLEESERLLAYTKARLKNDPAPITYESKWFKKDGSVVWFLASIQMLDWGGERVAQALYLDITEKRQMEDTLRRTQKMDAMGQLTGGIAHDFNNILGIILGNLGLLKLQLPAESKAIKNADAIEKASQRAVSLTRQILGFSRKKRVDVCIADINVLIQNMDDLISRSITPEVEIDKQLSDNLWHTEIDRNDFEDALLNLVLNARDAMPNDGRLIIETDNQVLDPVYCAQHSDVTPGEYVKLSLKDTGDGISAEEQEHIFEPFFTTKAIGKGTGLGLSMVFGFINRSHGHIEVNSELGVGTTFSLYLPRAKVEQPQHIETIDFKFDEKPMGDELILVVDDEPGLVELAKNELQFHGYQVLTASNGRQALEQLDKNPGISLLFSDVVMPGGMNGYDLAEKVVMSHPEIKVLLTSGHTKKESQDENEKYILLKKPYSHKTMVYQVRSLLDENR